jgi:hypothetical protein
VIYSQLRHIHDQCGLPACPLQQSKHRQLGACWTRLSGMHCRIEAAFFLRVSKAVNPNSKWNCCRRSHSPPARPPPTTSPGLPACSKRYCTASPAASATQQAPGGWPRIAQGSRRKPPTNAWGRMGSAWGRMHGVGMGPHGVSMGPHGVGMGLAWGWHGVDMGLAWGWHGVDMGLETRIEAGANPRTGAPYRPLLAR